MAVSFNKPGFKKVKQQTKTEQVIEKEGQGQGVPAKEIVVHDSQSQELVTIPEPVSFVEVGIHITVNTGNYNSVKMFVGIKRPCPAISKEEDAAYEYCKQWAGSKLEDLHGTYIAS